MFLTWGWGWGWGWGDADLSRLRHALSTGLLITVTVRSFVAAHAVTWKSAQELKRPQVNMPLHGIFYFRNPL